MKDHPAHLRFPRRLQTISVLQLVESHVHTDHHTAANHALVLRFLGLVSFLFFAPEHNIASSRHSLTHRRRDLSLREPEHERA